MLKKCLLSGRTIRPDERVISIPCASKGAQAKTGFISVSDIPNGYTRPNDIPDKGISYSLTFRFTRKGNAEYKGFKMNAEQVTAFIETTMRGIVKNYGGRVGEYLYSMPQTTFCGMRYQVSALVSCVDVQSVSVKIEGDSINFTNVNKALRKVDAPNVWGGNVPHIENGELKKFSFADIDQFMRGLDCLARLVKASDKSEKVLSGIIEKSAREEYPVDKRAEKMTVKGSKA